VSRVWVEEHQRLFVACDLPGDVGQAVGDWQRTELEPRDELRVSASLHLTLCFLGATPVGKVPAIVQALAGLAFAPFEVEVAGPLLLPVRGPKRVVALGLDDLSGALGALQAGASERLTALGVYKPEKRPFLPHLTVARYRRPGQPFSLHNVTIGRFGVDRMVLYSSSLERAGAVHTPLAVFPASQ
jgi:2'-5' RNA ligase